ncbi:type I-E CRISPR-associated protein Cas5/CasD [Salinactinospora qingdaonensis]|uniref:Type I-E CRISPR-associated protein Cas5/CasD n=1 Tax=Salinactinospora qingdaonensis TaxID=702744 RepID=A0ABP7FWR4_9ACTN
MSALALRLAGPLQAWGAAARFARRTTENAPTKSGILGLLAAAQGRERTDDLSDLARLRFGVRVDQRGVRVRDYQTAKHLDTGNSMPVSERFYLADAVFVAAVEGEHALVEELYRAVRQPVYLPYLGRRSCPPAHPVDLGLHRDATVERVLADEPWQAAEWHQRRRRGEREVSLDVFVDAEPDDVRTDSLRDLPLSFDPLHRRYALRAVRSGTVRVANPHRRADTSQTQSAVPEHNPVLPLEGD